jgi:hypothetical protein
MAGWIFCLTNEIMPGLVTINVTNSFEKTPEMRAKALYTAALPAPFKVVLKKKVRDPNQKKKHIYKILSKNFERVNPKRGFFKTTPSEVSDVFNLIDEYEEIEEIEEPQLDQNSIQELLSSQKYTEVCNILEEFNAKKKAYEKNNKIEISDEDAERFWNQKKWQKQKKQLIAWKNIKDEKTRQNTNLLPSIISECKNEAKLARLRQRIRARQATPKCWPQRNDSEKTIKTKEAYISYIVGGNWFNK